MNDLVLASVLGKMSPEAIDKVRRFEAAAMQTPQLDLKITHAIHAGVYHRTVTMPPMSYITGAEIKIPTMVIVSGHVSVFTGEETVELFGYHVIHAEAGRKQAFVAFDETSITMIFRTDAKTVEEAELEFTDEAHLLTTRRNHIEGGIACQG